MGAAPAATAANDAPPVDMTQWRAFCAAVAERYHGRVSAYQIWNEPNLSREWGDQQPTPAGYVELLAACSGGIREADPGAVLISAGWRPLAPTMIRRCPMMFISTKCIGMASNAT